MGDLTTNDGPDVVQESLLSLEESTNEGRQLGVDHEGLRNESLLVRRASLLRLKALVGGVDEGEEHILQQENIIVWELVQIAIISLRSSLVNVPVCADKPEDLGLIRVGDKLEAGVTERRQRLRLIRKNLDRTVTLSDNLSLKRTLILNVLTQLVNVHLGYLASETFELGVKVVRRGVEGRVETRRPESLLLSKALQAILH